MIASHPWYNWYHHCQRTLGNIAVTPDSDDVADQFLQHCYKQNVPVYFKLPDWPILQWSWSDVYAAVGDQRIQFQKGRSTDTDYEFQSFKHCTHDTFDTFYDLMGHGPVNDVYITAQNADYNRPAFAPLYKEIQPLPAFLRPYPEAGFFWIGGATMTPLHHDKTNNLMCQILGDKVIRLVPPSEFYRLNWRAGVHSYIRWLDDDYAKAHDIYYKDIILTPGYALFLPVGWWHCVKTEAPSMTAVYTNFLWPNNFTEYSL